VSDVNEIPGMLRIVEQLAALLFGERLSNGYYDGHDARAHGFNALANGTPSVREQYREKARLALEATGVLEALTAARRNALIEAAQVCRDKEERWRATVSTALDHGAGAGDLVVLNGAQAKRTARDLAQRIEALAAKGGE
jgi:hypothetical protein